MNPRGLYRRRLQPTPTSRAVPSNGYSVALYARIRRPSAVPRLAMASSDHQRRVAYLCLLTHLTRLNEVDEPERYMGWNNLIKWEQALRRRATNVYQPTVEHDLMGHASI